MACTVRARLLDPEQACKGSEAGQSEPVLTWQQHLACSGEQHVDLGSVTLQQPQLWWPINMGAQVWHRACCSATALQASWHACDRDCVVQTVPHWAGMRALLL